MALAAVAALACVVAIGASLMSSAAIESRRLQTLESVSATTYVVRPGDSVWRIAEENPVDGLTTSEVVSYIEGANDLKSVCLNPGQVIDIPV